MQEVIVIILLVGALFYIGYRAYKSYNKKKCGDGDCGCK
jgi:Tfp pilus assembly protein PilE